MQLEGWETSRAIEKHGLTEYGHRKALSAFTAGGVAGLIGLDSERLTEELSVEAERMVFVLKEARPWIPATKMRLILQGFDYDIPMDRMRHLYASYGWARGTKPYQGVDFRSLNLKVMQLGVLQSRAIADESFLHKEDPLQGLLEVFRTLHIRGVTKRYAGSRVSFAHHKDDFLSLGLLGLVDRARPAFRNSKMGFAEEGRLILSPTPGQRARVLSEDSAVKEDRSGSYVCDEDLHEVEGHRVPLPVQRRSATASGTGGSNRGARKRGATGCGEACETGQGVRVFLGAAG